MANRPTTPRNPGEGRRTQDRDDLRVCRCGRICKDYPLCRHPDWSPGDTGQTGRGADE